MTLSLEAEVLALLQKNKQGLRTKDVIDTLAHKRRNSYGALTFDDEVQLRSQVERALFTLKSRHQAWPHASAAEERSATNTSGGRGHAVGLTDLHWRYIERGEKPPRRRRKIPQRRSTRLKRR